jgi:hypothetical protein
MVELGVNNLLEPWPYCTIPRVVKTHKRYWHAFGRARAVIGLVRDPRDVMVSSFHFKKDRRGSYQGNFSAFVRHPDFGLESWFKHYVSWRSHWDLVVNYADMRQNTRREFARILGMLDVACPEEVVTRAIERSSIENVREIEASAGCSTAGQSRFARDGSVQQWPSYFNVSDLDYYRALLEEYDVISPHWEPQLESEQEQDAT